MNKSAPYVILLVLTIVATVGGVLTLIPWPNASYPNVLGYKSLCTFAPAATLFCFAIAGLSCYFRASLVKDQGGSAGDRLRRHGMSLAPIALLLILAVGATVWFLVVKGQYPDGESSATPVSVTYAVEQEA
ncbi:MAG: hypothetical protein GVY29_13030 [Spirochaetes bacterium]|nr:hypothetical protein [Spirochaetota bacterium]